MKAKASGMNHQENQYYEQLLKQTMKQISNANEKL